MSIEANAVDERTAGLHGPGQQGKPWYGEPDRVEFEHAGLPCLLSRGWGGVWCGYAAVPPGHPLHGRGYDEVTDVDVHGGLTYASACSGRVCHVPKPGQPDDVFWFGFDTGHGNDLPPLAAFPNRAGAVYRDLAYVRAQTERLAEQLAAAGAGSEGGAAVKDDGEIANALFVGRVLAGPGGVADAIRDRRTGPPGPVPQ